MMLSTSQPIGSRMKAAMSRGQTRHASRHSKTNNGDQERGDEPKRSQPNEPESRILRLP